MTPTATYRDRLPDLDALRAAALEERTEMITAYLCRELTELLDVPPAHRVSRSRPLRTQGVGSITGLQVKRLLEVALQVDLHVADILSGDSVSELAAKLAGRLTDRPGSPAPLAAPALAR
ncbi:acyl carrier protein [Streptomyces sp. TRM 70351]|uniref:acyl carrier protein n=1 Tax=Streptomyces sp. TRM 70351 TaxID=3116552 RepID=UPI002E7AE8A1|nr:acyl carrier protein [Streptomyces sp. TRM 70351]MEE1930429.1 acyl carrier protein [Streptomyces sp. TRM 70351]